MRILMISHNDPAGMGIAFARAVNRFSEHECRLITRGTRYDFGFDRDLHVPDLERAGRLDEIPALLARADVVHFHILMDENERVGGYRIADHLRSDAVIVHHHHGHPALRADPAFYARKYRRLGRRVAVSTPDLAAMLEGSFWIPNLVPVDDDAYSPLPREGESAPVIVTHSPTREDLKNTAEFERAMDALIGEGLPVEKRVIRRVPHGECLRIKRRSHAFFDHMQGYYGVSSLEALSQGLPVIAGLDAHNRRMIAEFTGTSDLPWLIARDEAALRAALRELIVNPEKRREAGRRAREFMLERWHPRHVVARLEQFYALAMGSPISEGNLP